MDDLISRRAAIDAVRQFYDEFSDNEKSIEEIIAELPTAQRKTGKWIATHERGLFSHPDSITYVCSECGNKIYTIYGVPKTTKFCWECGAKMEGDPDE